MSEGKSFQIHAPVTGKAQHPAVDRWIAGTDYWCSSKKA